MTNTADKTPAQRQLHYACWARGWAAGVGGAQTRTRRVSRARARERGKPQTQLRWVSRVHRSLTWPRPLGGYLEAAELPMFSPSRNLSFSCPDDWIHSSLAESLPLVFTILAFKSSMLSQGI